MSLTETSRVVKRYENVKEDEELEVNPYAFMKYDEEKSYTHLLAVGTEFTPEYIDFIDKRRFFMGHLYIMNETVLRAPSGFYYFAQHITQPKRLPSYKTLSQQFLNTQRLHNTTGLLTLSEYIKSRVVDLALAINEADLDVEVNLKQMPPSGIKTIHETNCLNYLLNNSWSFTPNFHIFCPMMSKHDNSLYTLKFLRLDRRDLDFTIYPFIYSITLEKLPGTPQRIPVLTPEGAVVEIWIELGPINSFNGFPESVRYYSPSKGDVFDSFEAELPEDTPNDCVVVSMFMCGMLPQPDMTRYHNLFRQIYVHTKNVSKERRVEHTLSYGYANFVSDIMTRRIHSFYNRETPSKPLRELQEVLIYINRSIVKGKDYDRIHSVQDGIIIYQSKLNPNMLLVNGHDPTKSKAENFQLLTRLLNHFGCNRPNVLFPITVLEHQLLMSFDGKYLIRDPQPNMYYRDLFNHPSHYKFDDQGKRLEMDQDACIGLFCSPTSLEPQKFSIISPEMPTLYEYYHATPEFNGDPFPLVSNFIDKFVLLNRESSRLVVDPITKQEIIEEIPRSQNIYDPVPGQKNLEDSFAFDLSIKDVTLTDIQRELTRIDLESLGLMQHPNPQISFNYYNRLFSALERVISDLSTLEGQRAVRQFASEYQKLNAYDIIQLYTRSLGFLSRAKYHEKDVYNLLLSRPLFCSFVKHYITLSDDGLSKLTPDVSQFHTERVNRVLANYLSQSTKEVLPLVSLFHSISKDASIVKLLSTKKGDTLANLVSFARSLSPFITTDLQTGLYKGLKRFAQAFDAKLRTQARAKIIPRIATTRVLLPNDRFLTASDIEQFFRDHPNVTLPSKEIYERVPIKRREVKRVKINDKALQKVILYRLTNKLNYKPEELESRMIASMTPYTRIRSALSRSPQAELIPLPSRRGSTQGVDDFEADVRRLERGIYQERLKSVYREPAEEEIANENLISDYLDAIIAHTMEELEEEKLEPEEEEQIDKALAVSPSEFTVALDVFVSIVNIIRIENKDIDKKYLGKK